MKNCFKKYFRFFKKFSRNKSKLFLAHKEKLIYYKLTCDRNKLLTQDYFFLQNFNLVIIII